MTDTQIRTCPVVPFTRIFVGCGGTIHRIEGDAVYVRGIYTYPESGEPPQRDYWEAKFKKADLETLTDIWFERDGNVCWDASKLEHDMSFNNPYGWPEDTEVN